MSCCDVGCEDCSSNQDGLVNIAVVCVDYCAITEVLNFFSPIKLKMWTHEKQLCPANVHVLVILQEPLNRAKAVIFGLYLLSLLQCIKCIAQQ